MSPVRRVLALVVVAGLALAATTVAAWADTQGDLDAARQALEDARNAANAAAADFSEADQLLAATQRRIESLEQQIDAGEAKAERLRAIARERAVFAYTHASHTDLDTIVEGTSGPLEAIRRQQLLDHANQTDNTVVRQLAELTEDLADQREELEREEATQKAASAQADAKLENLQAKQAEVQQAVAQLQQKLDGEIAAADAARRAELEREQAALAARSVVSNGGPGQIIVNPGGGPFQCPVAGAAYSDDYGGPRGHAGIDMFVPNGTPVVAVKAGTIWFMAMDGAGGNEVYLDTPEGNTYYYAHLSEFVGPPRAVAQGEVVGLTGMTGRTSAPHLHFEIRVGGANGNRINPYPTLKSAGC
jgi:murein DD-endopeptidase MepM/ murein hydrolase activator NlpD